MLDYLDLLDQDEPACRPTLRRTGEWDDDVELADLIPPRYRWQDERRGIDPPRPDAVAAAQRAQAAARRYYASLRRHVPHDPRPYVEPSPPDYRPRLGPPCPSPMTPAQRACPKYLLDGP